MIFNDTILCSFFVSTCLFSDNFDNRTEQEVIGDDYIEFSSFNFEYLYTINIVVQLLNVV